MLLILVNVVAKTLEGSASNRRRRKEVQTNHKQMSTKREKSFKKVQRFSIQKDFASRPSVDLPIRRPSDATNANLTTILHIQIFYQRIGSQLAPASKKPVGPSLQTIPIARCSRLVH
jgi:hypothetical protein